MREGVFLSDFLRKSSKGELKERVCKLPEGLNISAKSLQDRFMRKSNKTTAIYAGKIYDILAQLHGLDGEFKNELVMAAKLHNIGTDIGFYSDHINSAYLIKNGLNFSCTHAQKALIATMIATNGKKSIYEYDRFKPLLPKQDTIRWLSFMLAVARVLNIACYDSKLVFSYHDNTLFIEGAQNFTMAKEEIKKLFKPETFAVSFI